MALIPLIACGGDATPTPRASPDGPAVAAIVATEGPLNAAQSVGMLGGDATTGCLWLTVDGRREQLLLQGQGLRLDWALRPAAVLRGDQVLARLGDAVTLRGGYVSRAMGLQGVSGCPVGPERLWLGAIVRR